MSLLVIIAGTAAVTLFVYLSAALLFPEADP